MNEREKIIRLWFDMWLKQQDLGMDKIFTEGKRCQREYQGYADTDRLCGVFRKGKGKVQRVRL